MASKHIRTDAKLRLAYRRDCRHGPEGAVNIVYRRELDKAPESEREILRQEKIAEFRDRFANPFVAAERGYIDAVIEPADTRTKIITALRASKTSEILTRRKNTATFHCKHAVLSGVR